MAYAAVISLKHTIHRHKNSTNILTKSSFEELNSLVPMLKRLDDDSMMGIDRRVINELDAKIRYAVWKLEDVLESSLSLIPPSQGHDENGVEQEIHSFFNTVKKLRRRYNRELQNPLFPGEEGDAVPPMNKSTTIWLSDQTYNEVMAELLHGTSSSQLKAVALVGMAGIGKTHLATQIYHHPLIDQHFDSRLWVRVGPGKQVKNVFVDIIAQIERKPTHLFKGKSTDALLDLVEKSLHGRRFLIVLNDIWSTNFSSYFRFVCSFDKNGSRFLLTTRLQEVGKFWTSKIHRMPFLNNEESWNLLWQNVFVAEKSFPPQLEKPGRKIVEICEGLPLLILAVANILRGLDKTEEYWKMVAEKKTTTFTDAYDQIYEVLLPSYEYLPQHLKPCFLYMGVFPQSCEIPISKLINLWVVEDFLEPTLHPAMECLEDLVSNSLAMVCKRSFGRGGRIKSSKLHSAYWYLCVSEARKSEFFHVLNKLTDVSTERRLRRLSVQNNILFGIKEVYESMAADTSSTTRSLLFTGEDHQYPVRICLNTMVLMRVLDALAIRFYEFPNEVLKLLQLRYLSLTHNGELPSSISNLQQLQCLIIRRHHNIIFLQRDSSCLPEEIWDMQELRHLRITGSNLPDPSKGAKLPKLVTLYVNAQSCTEAVLRSIPHLKKLGIKIELQPDASAETLRCLDDCSPSVVASARQLMDNAKSSNLQLVISSSWNLR